MKDERKDLPLEDPRRVDRIRAHTPADVLDRIDARTAARVFRAARGGTASIERRIAAIDAEWDIDRVMQLGFALATVVSSVRGRKSRLWRTLLRAQQAFLVLDAVIGWAPPVAVMRRLGIRTQKEIDTERGVLVELLHLLRDDAERVEVIAYEVDRTSEGTAARW